MSAEVDLYIEEAKDLMEKAIAHLEIELTKLRAGKANPAIVDNIFVDYYGNKSPINQVAGVKTSDARTLVIQPWEKAMLEPIEKAIIAANIGITPQSDGTAIRLVVPILTEESRKALVKKSKDIAEHTRISVRNIRRDANESIKKLSKDGLSEDLIKAGEDEVQKVTNQYIQKIDKHLEAKEQEIMKV